MTYTDAQGGGKSAYLASQNRTQWKESGPPEFLDPDGENLGATTTREVNENARAGTNVGAPVAATDIGNRGIPENLTYELSGTSDTGGNEGDFNSFDIDPRTGQIKVKRGTTLDYEADKDRQSYEVTVTATDPSDTDTGQHNRYYHCLRRERNARVLTFGTRVETTGDFNSGFTHPEPVVG